VNPFILPELEPEEGDNAAALARKWGAVLGLGNTLSFSDASRLFKQFQPNPFTHWETVVTCIDHWAVACHALLGGDDHPGKKQLENLLGTTDPLRSQLRLAARHKPALAVSVVRELQLEYNESFRQSLHGAGPVMWPQLESITRQLTTGK